MAYVALYRTWRPQDFDDLVGQAPIKKALTNALETGRISHAYLFAGPRGTGKTSTARILAKALNCEKGPTAHPCNQCSNCREITEGTSMKSGTSGSRCILPPLPAATRCTSSTKST